MYLSRFNEAAADDRGKPPTLAATWGRGLSLASMRPRPMTAENPGSMRAQASMSPALQ